jgi:hypothetical protein
MRRMVLSEKPPSILPTSDSVSKLCIRRHFLVIGGCLHINNENVDGENNYRYFGWLIKAHDIRFTLRRIQGA